MEYSISKTKINFFTDNQVKNRDFHFLIQIYIHLPHQSIKCILLSIKSMYLSHHAIGVLTNKPLRLRNNNLWVDLCPFFTTLSRATIRYIRHFPLHSLHPILILSFLSRLVSNYVIITLCLLTSRPSTDTATCMPFLFCSCPIPSITPFILAEN